MSGHDHTTNPLRIGLIGCGGIATTYRNGLQQLGYGFAAVYDSDSQRAEQFAAASGARLYESYQQMLADAKLDAVMVAIPPGAQMAQVADAARAGCAVFVTKPVALDWSVVRDTAAAIQATGVINQVGYMTRYSDVTEHARVLIGDRPLQLGTGYWRVRMSPGHPWWGKRAISGGQLLEQTTHCVDLLRYFLGDVQHVYAVGHTNVDSDIADFEDSSVCALRFTNGAVGSVVSSYRTSAPDGAGIELSGPDIALRLGVDWVTTLSGHIDGKPVSYQGSETGYVRQLEVFLRAVIERNQTIVRSSYADAARTLAVTLAANRSMQTGLPELVATL